MAAVEPHDGLVPARVEVQRLAAVLVLGLAVRVHVRRGEVQRARPVGEQDLALL